MCDLTNEKINLQLTIQFGQNQITARMESLINNPGFDNITKKIFLLLDHETLLTCRLVCKSFKTKVEDPYCWIKRCSQLGQPKSLTNSWTDLVQYQTHKKSWLMKYIKMESKNCRDGKTLWQLEQKFVLCLIKWTLNFPLLAHLELGGFDPLCAAAQYGCLEVIDESWTDLVQYQTHKKSWLIKYIRKWKLRIVEMERSFGNLNRNLFCA